MGVSTPLAARDLPARNPETVAAARIVTVTDGDTVTISGTPTVTATGDSTDAGGVTVAGSTVLAPSP